MQHRSIGLSLAALLLVACANSSVGDGAASTSANEPQAKARTSDIVLTGSIGLRTQSAEAAPMAVIAPPPPPPPPPPPAPGMYVSQGWSPAYHDQGRDKFTSV